MERRRKLRALLLYAFILIGGIAALLAVLRAGADLPSGPVSSTVEQRGGLPGPDLLTLLVQIALILTLSRAAGWLFRRIHQPQVVGEMAAGLLLGPSVLGALAPVAYAQVFPPESLGYLSTLSQIGLVLFMFMIGLEFDPKLLRGRGHTALLTSHVSIVLPFALGAWLALFLYPRMGTPGVPFIGFALFMGAAMSVTAFPVLARILTERKLLSTRLGAIALACAAIDDVTAWCILAGVVIVVRRADAAMPLAATIGGTAAFVVFMLAVARPLARRASARFEKSGEMSQDWIAVILLGVLACAWFTEWLGIHALFGAFLAGAVIPNSGRLVHNLVRRLEDFTVVFLLPLFFAFTGLRTSIGDVGGMLWVYAALTILVAVVGKLGGSAIAARVTGLPWRESLALGILMNTRGLMELVILNIGLDIGVISPEVFTIMVVMALVTTFMTTPALQLVLPTTEMRRKTAMDS